MKITYLELLEMIREEKAPKKVRYENKEYINKINSQFPENVLYVNLKTGKTLKENYKATDYGMITNHCIEIIQEDEFEEIEEIDMVDNDTLEWTGSMLGTNFQILNETINKLISNQKIIKKLAEKE